MIGVAFPILRAFDLDAQIALVAALGSGVMNGATVGTATYQLERPDFPP